MVDPADRTLSFREPAQGHLTTGAGDQPDVLQRDEVLVHKGLVDHGQDVQAFSHLPKHSVDAIQVVQVLPRRDEELRTGMRQSWDTSPWWTPQLQGHQGDVAPTLTGALLGVKTPRRTQQTG